jgi:adenylate cyclase
VVELVEAAIDEAGIPVPRPAWLSVIAFLDLTGFTSLTEELGDEAEADRSLMLARLIQEPVGRHDGSAVKMMGDGAMLKFAEPHGAARCGLELVDRVTGEGLPSARMGIAAHPVEVFRVVAT